MTLLDETTQLSDWMAAEARPAPRKLRGLRFPVIPKPSWLIQLGGGIATLSGVWMQWGTAVALMAGGATTIVVSMLKEAGMLKESDEA
jgi:hypothetical protein